MGPLLLAGIAVTDLAAASRGLHPTAGETYGNGVRRVVSRDADGNEFAFGGMPVDGP